MLPRLRFALLLGAIVLTGASAAVAEMNDHHQRGAYGDQRGYGGGRSSGRFLYDFDQNHDGKVTKDELNRTLYQRFTNAAGGGKTLSSAQFAADAARRHRDREGQLFRRADWNGDGKLTLDEYMAPLRAKFSNMDRKASGVYDCSRRARANAFGDGNRDKPQRHVRSTRGLCFTTDLNQDGKVTRAEFDSANAKKFAEAAHGGKALSFDQFASAGNGRYRDVSGRIFDRMDGNHDGKLTLAEYAVPQQKQFARMDRNHDGVITRDEAASGSRRSGGFGGPGRFSASR